MSSLQFNRRAGKKGKERHLSGSCILCSPSHTCSATKKRSWTNVKKKLKKNHTHSSLVNSWAHAESQTCTDAGQDSERVDWKTTYCQKCGVDQSWRLHGSVKESAHTLTHRRKRPLPPQPQPRWPLFLFPFPSLLLFPSSKRWKRPNSDDSKRAGTAHLKSLPPPLLFTSTSRLRTLLLPRSDWPGNLNYSRDEGLRHGPAIQCWPEGARGEDWKRQEEEKYNCQGWKDRAPPPAVLFLIIQRVHYDNDQTRQMTGDNHPKRFGSFGLQLQLWRITSPLCQPSTHTQAKQSTELYNSWCHL